MSTYSRVLRSVSEVEGVRQSWTEMQQHPNSEIDFFLEVLHSSRGPARPHVVMLYRDGVPSAVLVGRLEQTRLNLRIGYADFLRPKARSLTFIYGGLLGDTCSDNCNLLAQAVMRSLREGEADVAFFNHLRLDSPLFPALCREAPFFSRDRLPAQQVHRTMALPSSVDAFWSGLSAKVRKNQRWQAKKLLHDHDGNVEVRCFRNTSDLEGMIGDVEQVAQKTYQRGLGVGFVDDATNRRSWRFKAEKGWLRTYVLYVADQPWAFWSGTVYRGVFHSDFMGYDPAHSKYSPGMYLVMRVIEDFCTQNQEVKAIDFGLGDAQYKEVLGNTQWEDVSTYLFAPRPRGLALNALRTPVLFMDRIGRKALGSAQLLSRIKRLWRNRAGREPSGTPPLRQAVANSRSRESVSAQQP